MTGENPIDDTSGSFGGATVLDLYPEEVDAPTVSPDALKIDLPEPKIPTKAMIKHGRIEKKDEKTILDGIRKMKPIFLIAQEIGVSRQALYNYVRNKMDTTFRDMREAMVDICETKLLQNVMDGNQNAIEYFLNAQGRGRGYGAQGEKDRQDVPIIKIGKIEVTNSDFKPEVASEKERKAETVEAEVVEVKSDGWTA